MLSFEELAPLRLRTFLPPGFKVTDQEGWEWRGGTWLYEGVGFTWFGRLEEAPNETAGIELFFEEIPIDSLQRILTCLGLPLRPGMRLEEVASLFGGPLQTLIFADDRKKTYEYQLNAPQAYLVSCTIHETEGLIHLSVIRNDVRRRLAVA